MCQYSQADLSEVVQVGELMSVPGLSEALVALLAAGASGSAAAPADEPMDGASPAAELVAGSSPVTDAQLAADLLTEVSWVLAYVTAGAEAHLNRMVALGVVPSLVAHLVWCTQQVTGQLKSAPSWSRRTLAGAFVRLNRFSTREMLACQGAETRYPNLLCDRFREPSRVSNSGCDGCSGDQRRARQSQGAADAGAALCGQHYGWWRLDSHTAAAHHGFRSGKPLHASPVFQRINFCLLQRVPAARRLISLPHDAMSTWRI